MSTLISNQITIRLDSEDNCLMQCIGPDLLDPAVGLPHPHQRSHHLHGGRQVQRAARPGLQRVEPPHHWRPGTDVQMKCVDIYVDKYLQCTICLYLYLYLIYI